MTISSCYDCYWWTTIKHARTQARHSKVEYVSSVIFHLEDLIQAVKGPNTLIKLSKGPRFHCFQTSSTPGLSSSRRVTPLRCADIRRETTFAAQTSQTFPILNVYSLRDHRGATSALCRY